ncbi:MAG TPA: magnesium transporter [Methylibium sp.]|nr:magnesium transporter [Methylibium sp.]
MNKRHHETAGRLASRTAPLAPSTELAGELRRRLRTLEEPWELVCITDDGGHLLGVVPAHRLLSLPDATPLGEAVLAAPRVLPDTDQERVASLALHHGLPAMPVVDAEGRPIGVVGSATLLRILREEHVEDLHHLAGISRETRRAREAIDAPPLRRARHRLPWLFVGLLGSMLATFVMSRFETALAAQPSIAFFVPALVYLADAIGTQTEAVAVRGLSLSHAGLARLVGGELRTGLLIGGALALVALPLAWLFVGDLRLALAVAAALAGAGAVACGIGLLLPWLLGTLRLDPAYGAGPLATIVQDVLTLLIYFAGVSLIVG